MQRHCDTNDRLMIGEGWKDLVYKGLAAASNVFPTPMKTVDLSTPENSTRSASVVIYLADQILPDRELSFQNAFDGSPEGRSIRGWRAPRPVTKPMS